MENITKEEEVEAIIKQKYGSTGNVLFSVGKQQYIMLESSKRVCDNGIMHKIQLKAYTKPTLTMKDGKFDYNCLEDIAETWWGDNYNGCYYYEECAMDELAKFTYTHYIDCKEHYNRDRCEIEGKKLVENAFTPEMKKAMQDALEKFPPKDHKKSTLIKMLNDNSIDNLTQIV